MKIVACGTYDAASPTLLTLLSPREPRELQSVAVRTLTGYSDTAIADQLLKNWSNYSPPTQFEVAEALALNPQRLSRLFDAIEQKQVSPAQLSPLRRTLLMKHFDPALRQRAIKLFGSEQTGSRAQVIAAYQSALTKPGRSANGQQIYQAKCMSCHKMGTQGFDVGPSLVTVQHRRPDEILTQILDPNREVGPNFVQYVVALDDGRTLTGMIVEETPNSITLRRQENKQDVILRSQIEELKNTGLSLMPEGLEKEISPDQMADLLAYLKGIKSP
ncbi:MAG: c-type cytochrome [Planctomycetales bacterium]